MFLGIGLSAKFIEKGGADLIIVYNSGRFRMAGRGSLAGMMPYGDANAIVLDMVSLQNLEEIYFCLDGVVWQDCTLLDHISDVIG